jgi:hypothetical protein
MATPALTSIATIRLVACAATLFVMTITYVPMTPATLQVVVYLLPNPVVVISVTYLPATLQLVADTPRPIAMTTMLVPLILATQ